jgi:hypothetical protein
LIVRVVALCAILGVLMACGDDKTTIADCSDEGNKVTALYEATVADLVPLADFIMGPNPTASQLNDSAATLRELADTLEERVAWPKCGDETRGHLADAAEAFAAAAQARADGEFGAYAEHVEHGRESLQRANEAIQQ